MGEWNEHQMNTKQKPNEFEIEVNYTFNLGLNLKWMKNEHKVNGKWTHWYEHINDLEAGYE